MTARFFGWAHRNQMPIVDVRIDWGDESEWSGGPGKYQNHKPVCATGEDLATSVPHCTVEPELTCDTAHPCGSTAGVCRGDWCQRTCAGDGDCPTGSNCSGEGRCVREGRRCFTPPTLSTTCTCTGLECDADTECGGGPCINVDGKIHYDVAASCVPTAVADDDECTGTALGQCVGKTSFGDFPDACSTTPFRFRHTYRCEGVTDPAWNRGNPSANGCVFKPKVRLTDNWGWCTTVGGAGTSFDIWCDTQPEAWIEFAGDVVVR